jgi:hypothetical protein
MFGVSVCSCRLLTKEPKIDMCIQNRTFIRYPRRNRLLFAFDTLLIINKIDAWLQLNIAISTKTEGSPAT